MILDAAGSAGLSLLDIELFGITTGPGAFTGMRIGLATVGGLAFATGCPIVGVSSFDASAFTVPEHRRRNRIVLVALDSKRGDVFVCLFGRDGAPLVAPACVGLAAISEWTAVQIDRVNGGTAERLVIAGDAAIAAAAELTRQGWQTETSAGPVDPAIVASIAAQRRAQAQIDPPPPAYLVAPDASLSLPSRAIIP